MVARLAIALEDEAGSHDGNDRSQQSLAPPLRVVARKCTCGDRTEHAVVVERVDPHMRPSHPQEENPSVAAWEVEDEDAQNAIQQDVCIAAHLHRTHGDPLLSIAPHDFRVSAHDPLPKHERSDNGRHGLDEE